VLTENLCVPLYVYAPDKEPDFLTDSHVKLDILVDTQGEAFKYDEDTVSLLGAQTLSTLDITLSDNSNSSAGTASTAFKYEGNEIEDATPQFNYHGPKIKILKQELPVAICTADTIGSIRNQRLF
jgi:hypothetical protein